MRRTWRVVRVVEELSDCDRVTGGREGRFEMMVVVVFGAALSRDSWPWGFAAAMAPESCAPSSSRDPQQPWGFDSC